MSTHEIAAQASTGTPDAAQQVTSAVALLRSLSEAGVLDLVALGLAPAAPIPTIPAIPTLAVPTVPAPLHQAVDR